MTAIAIPRPRRRKSKRAQLAQTATQVWAAMQIGKAATKTAKKGAKTGAQTWATVKGVKVVGRGGKKLLLIPLAAAGGGVAAWKLRSGSSSSDAAPAAEYGSSVGPAATPSTVTPPKAAPGSTADHNGEAELSDPPAGASTPPITPPESTA